MKSTFCSLIILDSFFYPLKMLQKPKDKFIQNWKSAISCSHTCRWKGQVRFLRPQNISEASQRNGILLNIFSKWGIVLKPQKTAVWKREMAPATLCGRSPEFPKLFWHNVFSPLVQSRDLSCSCQAKSVHAHGVDAQAWPQVSVVNNIFWISLAYSRRAVQCGLS